MNPYPSEIWLADLGLTAGTRPVLVVSRYDPDPPRDLIIYIPLTTQYRESPYEVVLPRLRFLNQLTFPTNTGQILDIIDLADEDVLDIMRSRAVEQEVLDLLDEPISQ